MSRETLSAMGVDALLADVAKGSLVPGGISMAALAGAMGASLTSLVGRLTAGHPGYEPLTEEMERMIERALTLEEQLLALMDQELEAFNQLTSAFALPRHSSEEQAIRRDCLELARRGYTQVPLHVGQLALEVLRLTETAVRYGNREVLADGGMGFLACVSAVKGAALQVLINLRGEDDEWAATTREKVQKWLDEAAALETELWAHLMTQVQQEN